MAEKCEFSGQPVGDPRIRAYDRIMCECGSVQQAQWRTTGIVYKWHRPLQGKTQNYGSYWKKVDGEWVLQSSNGKENSERK